jgi:transposase-like protein
MAALEKLLEEERAAACGPRYAHDAARRASRHGHAPGELVMGGRRVAVRRPRARTRDGQEVVLPSWTAFSSEDLLDHRAVEQLVLGVSTRGYERSIEPLPPGVRGRGASKSTVSRRFVRATREQLDELLGRRLDDLELVVLMIDGLHVADHVVLVALGIDAEGKKHVLGLREGATENATACRALLADLRDRGLRTDRSILVVLDGAKALRRAVQDVFGDRAIVQRCQEHKKRNVEEQLPESMRPKARAAMNEAYRTRDAARARKLLENLARRLEGEHPGAVASLREGLDETLTVLAFKLPEALERTLATTNPIENLVGTCRRVTRNVRRWRGGSMIVRWIATSLLEASRGFRRLRGHRGMPQLVAALRARDARLDVPLDSAVAEA